mgnify:CR=1 FL=1
MKSIILARVSTKDQEVTGYSLPAQERVLQEYALRHGFIVAKVFSISESASKHSQRKTFNEMMAYAEKQKIKIIICEKVDRLTRNFTDVVTIDTWLEADEERHIHLVKDSLVLHKNARSQEKLNWGIRVVMAKNYIDNLKEEVKKGYDERLRQGGYPGSRPPIGYKSVGEKGRKKIAIDETNAPFVRRMFELYASGNYSLKLCIQTDFAIAADAGYTNHV